MEGRSFKPYSYWWKGVLSIKEIFKWGIYYKLGNGSNIKFWSDRWCGESSLQQSFLEVFDMSNCTNLAVRDCFVDTNWNWNRILGDNIENFQGLNPSVSEIKEKVSQFKVEHGPDIMLWRWSPTGQFTVRSTYVALSDGATRDRRSSKIWKLRVPLKVKVFCWLVLRKRLLTADNLVKRGWVGDTACVLCGTDEETMDHLFTQCVFTRFLILMGVEDVQNRDLGNDLTSTWDRWKGRAGGQPTRHCLTDLIVCWWIIWKERNDIIFRKTKLDPLLAVHKVKQLASFWEQFYHYLVAH